MFELAGLSTFLDIFQKAFGLIEKRKDQKRRLFEEIIEPIYTQLSPVVDQYHEFFRGCRDDFSQTEFKYWSMALVIRRRKREEIVFARNKVIGMVWPFLSEARKRGEQDELLYKFALGIQAFFYAPTATRTSSSRVSGLFEYIEERIETGNEKDQQIVIREIEDVLLVLENAWRDVSQAYGELRVYCLS